MTREEERSAALTEVERVLAAAGDVDDALAGVLDVLAALFPYASIRFVEDDDLVGGPEVGAPGDERTAVEVAFGGDPVGELVVTGAVTDDEALLHAVAALIAPYVLLGWDTGGEPWEA